MITERLFKMYVRKLVKSFYRMSSKEKEDLIVEERSLQLYDHIKFFSENVIKNTCEYLILNCKNFPKISEIHQAAKKEQARLEQAAQQAVQNTGQDLDIQDYVCQHEKFFRNLNIYQTEVEKTLCLFPTLQSIKTYQKFHKESFSMSCYAKEMDYNRPFYKTALCSFHDTFYKAHCEARCAYKGADYFWCASYIEAMCRTKKMAVQTMDETYKLLQERSTMLR